MTKAVLTISPSSIYDDLPEQWYHFPRTYLRQIEGAIGDWIVYYEPRRDRGETSSGGRQAYFAVARITGVRPDPQKADQFYAEIQDFLEFDRPVPFREGSHYYESALKRPDGHTNRGAFGRAVRGLPDDEYQVIVQAGFSRNLSDWEEDALEPELSQERPLYAELVQRPFRDQAFRRHVRDAYDNTCAITGLRLVNGGGRPEVQAAHIRPVEKSGPDSVRNGLALTGTVHWMFDRGLISLDDDYHLLVANHELPANLRHLVRGGHPIQLPGLAQMAPHPAFLAWHRRHVFHG